MNRFLLLVVLYFLVSMCASNTHTNKKNKIQHKDTAQQIQQRRLAEKTESPEIENRIDSLLDKMTINEKIGQMIQITVDAFSDIKEFNQTKSGITEITIDSAKLATFLDEFPIGSLINGYGFTPLSWYNFHKTLQEYNQKLTRMKIPILESCDHQHGANYVAGATIFPHSLNMACTFNKNLTAEEARITGMESAYLGHRWILAPIGDLGCNPLWPRIYETYGEDPYLVSELCKTQLLARQNNSIIAPLKQVSCAKHFIGYSDPKAGWDRTPTDISTQTLYEMHVPAFQTMIDNGLEAVMLNSGELNGEAVHASYHWVTQLLRDKMGFKGVVITDWNDILKMIKIHRAAANEKEATLIAINAGIDMTMEPIDLSFGKVLLELVKEGAVSEERINLSVARILRMKFKANLFDYPMPIHPDSINYIHPKKNQKIARQAADESVVLLKNESFLPLKTNIKNIVLAGPNANNKKALCGAWTYRWWPQNDSIFPEDMETFYSSLIKEFPKSNIKLTDNKNFISASKQADAIILALGEQPHAEGFGNVNNLSLDEDQQYLLDAAIKTNKPLIIIMIAARPLIVTKGYDNASAFIWAGLPGVQGAQTITGILSGRVNPSGKMSFSYPANNGHYYNYNHRPSHSIFDIPPQNPRTLIATFGDGLSYSKFEYAPIALSDSIIHPSQSITATISVKNTSNTDGKEAVLWYINDEIASITRPVKALKHFEKTMIKAGETKQFQFKILPEMLSFPDADGNIIVEDGYFTLMCGDQTIRFLYKSN